MAACGGDDDDDGGASSAEARICARADSCNLLVGQTAQDCTDELKLCTAQLTTAQRTDWSNQINECLKLADCNNAAACYQQIPFC